MLMFCRISHCFNASWPNRDIIFLGDERVSTPFLEKPKIKQIEKDCEDYGRNKGRHSGQILHFSYTSE